MKRALMFMLVGLMMVGGLVNCSPSPSYIPGDSRDSTVTTLLQGPWWTYKQVDDGNATDFSSSTDSQNDPMYPFWLDVSGNNFTLTDYGYDTTINGQYIIEDSSLIISSSEFNGSILFSVTETELILSGDYYGSHYIGYFRKR